MFATGQYAPESKEGQVRLAHELTHVIQQERAGPPIQGAIRIGSPTSVLEREANSVATGISRGRVSRISDGQVAHLQRQGMGDVRVAEAEMEEQADADTSPIDGEFWALPPGVERDAVPVFDDEDTQAVVGFRTRGSVTKVYDLEGTLVDISEPGLEAPLIDPIDILAGGLVGLGRGLVRGGGRAAARGALARGGGAALGRAGLRAAIGTLSRRVITAIRGVYRAIRFRGLLNFTETAAARMADVARRVPQHILKLAIRFGTRSPDPQGVAGAFRYVIPMFRNGKEYMLEVVIREADKTVLHFLYR